MNLRAVPPNAQLIIQLGSDGRLPIFLRSDGSRIPYTLAWTPPLHAHLEIENGLIVLPQPGKAPSQTFVVDPNMLPRTRRVSISNVRGVSIRGPETIETNTHVAIDSDAIAFRVEEAGEVFYELAHPDFYTLAVGPVRVTALYADGTEELLVDHVPSPPYRAILSVLLAIASLCFVRIAGRPE